MNSGNLGNILKDVLEFFKGDLWIKTGLALIFSGGITGVLIPTITFDTEYIDGSISNAPSTLWEITGVILTLIGIFIILYRLAYLRSHPAHLMYIRGFDNMDENPPYQALPMSDRSAKATKRLIHSYEKEKFLDDIKYIQRSFKEVSDEPSATKVYIAALGNFPSLFLIGTFLRDGKTESIIMDFERYKSKWYRLDKYAKGEVAYNVLDDMPYNDIDTAIKDITDNKPTDVGLSLAYTFDIPKDQIPVHIRPNTLFLKTSLGCGHDKLANIQSQRNMINELSLILNKLSKPNNVERIHLFMAAQASFTIALGKAYMNNAHGTLILHNYSHKEGYNLSIKYNKGEIDIV